jgi:hypothetical protein
MSEQPNERPKPKFDPKALGIEGLGKFIDPALARTNKPKLTEDEKAAKKAARKAVQRPRQPTPLQAAAQAIVDPEARELEGRRLYAGIGARKAKLIDQRQALLDHPVMSPEQDAALYDRYPDKEALNDYHSSAARAYRREQREFSDQRYATLAQLKLEIDALSTEQIEISHAYVRPETLAGFTAMAPWVVFASAAREAEARRAHNDDVRATIAQWIAEGGRFYTIAEVVAVIEARRAAADKQPEAEPVRRQTQRLRAKDFRPPAATGPEASPAATEDEPTGGM